MNIGKFDSVYRLIIVTSERCARLIAGEQPRVTPRDAKLTTISLEEVLEEKVGVQFTTREGEEITIGPFQCESSSE